ncbi:hypothetical protein [Micromonospora globispora]|uniref:hypothetical protein n=1 Tax=Micromonospora globispora TaxID=1450148 RepID=UPI001402409C|nr:hypothetical protein [Micromonospora globispora]
MLDDSEHVQPRSGQRSGFEEVGGEDRTSLAAQEGGPGLMATPGRGFDPVGLEDFPDGGGGDFDAQASQFAVDSPVAPARVFPRQAQDERLDAADGGWPAGPFRPGLLA